MGESSIQVDYDALETVSQRFARHAEATHSLARRLTELVQRVGPGVWQGAAAERFVAEMESDLLPALRRLGEALELSTKTTQEIARRFREAEEEAAALFALDGGGASTATPPALATPVVERYFRIDERERLLKEIEDAPTLAERIQLQAKLGAVQIDLHLDAEKAQAILDELAAATTEAEREEIRARLRDDRALMEGLAATLPADEFRSALTALHVNQPGTVAHSDAATADALIRAGLADYVDESNQVEGNVAIVDDANWKAATAGSSQQTQNSSGFVDSNGNIIIHQDRGNEGTMIHEGVHRYSHDAVRMTLSYNLNEGITEYFTRQVIADLPNGTAIVNNKRLRIYRHEYAVATTLVGLVGEETVAAAYFDGDTTALREAYMRASGRTEADWNAFLAHMNTKPINRHRALSLLTPISQPGSTPTAPSPQPGPR